MSSVLIITRLPANKAANYLREEFRTCFPGALTQLDEALAGGKALPFDLSLDDSLPLDEIHKRIRTLTLVGWMVALRGTQMKDPEDEGTATEEAAPATAPAAPAAPPAEPAAPAAPPAATEPPKQRRKRATATTNGRVKAVGLELAIRRTELLNLAQELAGHGYEIPDDASLELTEGGDLVVTWS